MCVSIGRTWGKRKVDHVMPWPHMPQPESPICPCHAARVGSRKAKAIPSCCNSKICNEELYLPCTWVYILLIYLKRTPCPCAVMQMCLTFTVLLHWSGSVLMPKDVIVPPCFWSSGIAQVLGEEKCLTCNSALLGLHQEHAVFGPPSLLPAFSLSSAPESPGSRVGPHSSCQPLLPPLVLLPLLTNFFSCVNASFLSVTDVCSALIFPLELPTPSAISLLFHFFPYTSIHEIQSVLAAFHALCSTRPN